MQPQQKKPPVDLDSDDDLVLADVRGSQPQSERPLPLSLGHEVASLSLTRCMCSACSRFCWHRQEHEIACQHAQLVMPFTAPGVGTVWAPLMGTCAGADKENARADKPSNVAAAAPPRAAQKPPPLPKQAPAPSDAPHVAPDAHKRKPGAGGHMRQTLLPFAKKPKPAAAPGLAAGAQQQAPAAAPVLVADMKAEPATAAVGPRHQPARSGSSQKPIVLD